MDQLKGLNLLFRDDGAHVIYTLSSGAWTVGYGSPVASSRSPNAGPSVDDASAPVSVPLSGPHGVRSRAPPGPPGPSTRVPSRGRGPPQPDVETNVTSGAPGYVSSARDDVTARHSVYERARPRTVHDGWLVALAACHCHLLLPPATVACRAHEQVERL